MEIKQLPLISATQAISHSDATPGKALFQYQLLPTDLQHSAGKEQNTANSWGFLLFVDFGRNQLAITDNKHRKGESSKLEQPRP